MASNNLSFPFDKLRGRENFDVWKRHARSYLVLKNCWKIVDVGYNETPTDKQLETNERALAEITLMIEPANFAHIATAKTAKEAWDALLNAFEDTGLTRKVELLKRLVQLKLSDFESVQEYVSEMIMMSLKVQQTGLKLDDELVASLMLAGLPEEFIPLVMAVENSKTKLSVDMVKNLLLQDAKFDCSKVEEKALVSNKKHNTRKPKCYACKKEGHIAKNCPQKTKANVTKKKYPEQKSSFATSLLASSSLLVTKNNNNNIHEWFIDSGATSHMTNTKSILRNIKKVSEKHVVVANNEKMAIEGAGDVNVVLHSGKKETNAYLRNVEYVPEMSVNLISVRQMTLKGNKVLFKDDICQIFNQEDELIATADVVNNLYKLNCEVNVNKNENAFIASDDFKLWHRRLAHICENNLKKVMGASKGVQCNGGALDEKCVVCIKGKQTRASFKETGHRASGLLHIVHSDVMGPFRTKSFSGSRFLLTFVDDYSRKVYVVPIKRKSDVFEEFKRFKMLAEMQCEAKIKVLRTDNGTEYTGNQFENYLADCGIQHQKTAPYTPEQNGVAERINRTIMERVRCMLLDAGLADVYWAEAAMTSAYLINLVPCRGNEISPEEMWSGKKPNLKHLRVFGSKAFVHIPKQKRNKLSAKSTECILMGYSSESKAYRMQDPITRKIIISRDVIFIENNNKVCATENNFTNCKSLVVDIGVEHEIVNSGEDNVSELTMGEEEEDFIGFDSDEFHDTFSNNGEISSSSGGSSDEQNNERSRSDGQSNEIARSSERIANLPRPRYNLCVTQTECGSKEGVPETFDEAILSSQADLWKTAMISEMESLTANNTWCLTELPQGKKAIKCKWVYKTKFNANGDEVCHKARLVVKGCSQRKGIDYEETFAPVVRYTSLRFLFAMAAKNKLMIHQLDAVTAFLNGDLEEQIFMVQPEGFDDGSGRVCSLKKSLYGLKQSSRVWNKRLNEVLLKFGLQRSEVDQCVYYCINGEMILYVAIYVDDVLVFCNDMDVINQLKLDLSTNFKMKDLGEAFSVLGVRITRDKQSGAISIDQTKYIEDVLNRFSMSECKPVSTPMDVGQKLTSEMSPTDEFEKQEMAKVPYMQAVGCLLFASQITRPDISYAVNVLSRFNVNPGKSHWAAVKRVMRYLKGTIDKGLTYKCEPSDLVGFCDADWAGDIDDRRSTTGYLFTLQDGAISWCTRRQRTVALSSTEAEYMAMVAAMQESIWLQRLQRELIQCPQEPMILYCDNKSAILIAQNNSFSNRTKHVDLKVKFVKEKLEKKEVILKYVDTKNMIADFLTKAVCTDKLNMLSSKSGLK